MLMNEIFNSPCFSLVRNNEPITLKMLVVLLGIMQDIPKGYSPQDGQGRILKEPILSGLWNHYYREAA